jgi:hypothetical protein
LRGPREDQGGGSLGFQKGGYSKKNHEYSIDPMDYNVEVVPAATLDGYLRECLVEEATITFLSKHVENQRSSKAYNHAHLFSGNSAFK